MTRATDLAGETYARLRAQGVSDADAAAEADAIIAAAAQPPRQRAEGQIAELRTKIESLHRRLGEEQEARDRERDLLRSQIAELQRQMGMKA